LYSYYLVISLPITEPHLRYVNQNTTIVSLSLYVGTPTHLNTCGRPPGNLSCRRTCSCRHCCNTRRRRGTCSTTCSCTRWYL